ncbi:hypothetical protein PRIPAC_96784 [Pristionchus pacificus]|uniref:Uncharacterized protein n=1 Tax=Pristionchus pacificus TaxID=54126 RepID=A0A2A6BIV3_PRIPA|nr:hypothetical protein PRIPAC_96784 [Pristionchus pacificus]|eukprot:PDM65756.1 hypothetical protein PRIPAC_45157 [Pristionchus pacificus]
MFSQYVGSCVFPRPNVSGFHVPGEEKRAKLRNRKKRFPAVKKAKTRKIHGNQGEVKADLAAVVQMESG